MKDKPTLCYIVPVYNEEDVVEIMVDRLTGTLEMLSEKGVINGDSYTFFIDDGSSDGTLSKLRRMHSSNPSIRYISLDRNYGQQSALYRGMLEAIKDSDIMISMDGDGQHDPGASEALIVDYLKGNDIVFAVRTERDIDPVMKRATAYAYYMLLKSIGINTLWNHSDYRLVSKRAACEFFNMPKKSIFFRSQLKRLPFSKSQISFQCRPRTAGKSKYSITKQIRLALSGLISEGYMPPLKSLLFAILIACMSLFLIHIKAPKSIIVCLTVIGILFFVVGAVSLIYYLATPKIAELPKIKEVDGQVVYND